MKKFIFTFLSIILAVTFAFSQNFSTSGLTQTSSKNLSQDKSVTATYMITHSASQTILGGNSVACNAGGLHTDNNYLRVFDLVADFGINEDIDISSIDFGVETATGSGGSQPATVNIYTLSGAFVYANLTLIASQAISVADQTSTILNVPISATIPAGSLLVVEIFTPDGQGVGNAFFIGSNNLGETAPSYLSAPACGIVEPTELANIGFPGNQYVINVNADPAGGPPAVPVNSWAIILSLLFISGFVIYQIRK